MLTTIFAFLLAVSVLIFVHELGHYKVARWCGVKVERFAIGFGKPLLKWQPKGSDTEFVLAVLPFGGYVKMVDERQGPVAPADLPFAFSRQSLAVRSCIVAAGPIANLITAVMLYALVNWTGQMDAKPVLAAPVVGSVLDKAGVNAKDVVVQAEIKGESVQAVNGYSQLAWMVTRAAMQKQDLSLTVVSDQAPAKRTVVLPLTDFESSTSNASPLLKLGFRGVWASPEVGAVTPNGPADRGGVKEGDKVLKVDGVPVLDAASLREIIKSKASTEPLPMNWDIDRNGQPLSLTITPAVVQINGVSQGRIEAMIGTAFEQVQLRYDLWDGLSMAVVRTQEMAALTVKTLGQMVIGQASIQHLSGPLSIAEYAGKTAERGIQPFLLFLAVISVSLGVLNLLPIPVLDGGHLMYYLWEGITGKAVTERWLEWFQRGGTGIIVMLMMVGLFNDISRIFLAR